LAVVLLALCGWQATQACRAVFVLPSDARNPYAYVPTAPDLERATEWLESFAAAHPGLLAAPPAVVGVDYWPLPWYLRHFGPVGYYATPPPDLARRPLVFLAPPDAAEHLELLRVTHRVLPRGLRHETPLYVCIRRDVWAAWMTNG
jgi:predicted membrane-bound mannosyltransferase